MTHPLILLPKTRSILLPKARTEVSGYLRLQVRRPDGRVRHDTGWFRNLITNTGLDMEASGSIVTRCVVGTDNTPPAVTDTALGAQVAAVTASALGGTTGAASSAPYYGFYRRTFSFGEGAAAGNLAEVGITRNDSGAGHPMYSRALIVDGMGSPTTITVLADEFLDVTYERRLYAPTDDSEFVFGIEQNSGSPSAVLYDCVLRAAGVTDAAAWGMDSSAKFNLAAGAAYDGTLGPITGGPSGTLSSPSSSSAETYVAGTYQKEFNLQWNLSAGNLAGGITAMRLGGGTGGGSNISGGRFQVSFSPAIPKDNTKILDIQYRQAWARRP